MHFTLSCLGNSAIEMNISALQFRLRKRRTPDLNPNVICVVPKNMGPFLVNPGP